MARRFKNIEGAEQMQRAFRGISAAASENIAAALNKGAAEVAQHARLIAPVDDSTRGGRLRADIRTFPADVSATGKTIRSRVSVGHYPGTASYARQQEFGRRPSGRHPGHAAQPFMFPAYYSLRKRVRNRISRAVRAAIREQFPRQR